VDNEAAKQVAQRHGRKGRQFARIGFGGFFHRESEKLDAGRKTGCDPRGNLQNIEDHPQVYKPTLVKQKRVTCENDKRFTFRFDSGNIDYLIYKLKIRHHVNRNY
jgi:hypothetical protein